jgi:hypothetical protein
MRSDSGTRNFPILMLKRRIPMLLWWIVPPSLLQVCCLDYTSRQSYSFSSVLPLVSPFTNSICPSSVCFSWKGRYCLFWLYRSIYAFNSPDSFFPNVFLLIQFVFVLHLLLFYLCLSPFLILRNNYYIYVYSYGLERRPRQHSYNSDWLLAGRPKFRSSSSRRGKVFSTPHRPNRFSGPPSLQSCGYWEFLSGIKTIGPWSW